MATSNIRSQTPYFDDFDPSKDYVQVLFRPGYPVQARELSTLQSFLQEQITRSGETFYHEGELVKGADVTLNTQAYVINVLGSGSATYPSSGARSGAVLSTIAKFAGKIITNADGTVKARVLPSPLGITSDTQVGELYIQYITEAQFTPGYIYATIADNPGATSEIYNTFENAESPASIGSITAGIYFVNGLFVNVQEQSIVVSKTSQTPSVDIGVSVIESAITQNEDSSLFDNARGSTNEGAPGAHRLTFTCTLTSKPTGSAADSTFYRIATYIDGVKQDVEIINKQYEQLQEHLARRTYDESGHYALKPFIPTLEAIDSDALFMVNVSPSKAYVKGYEIEKAAPTKMFFDKESGTKVNRNFKIPVVGTTKVDVSSVTGTLPGSTSGAPFTSANHVRLTDGSNTIGVARAYAVNDELRKGVAYTELYLYDIRMFTTINTTGGAIESLTTGAAVTSGKTHGYIYKAEGTPDAGRVVVISSTGKFRLSQTITAHDGTSDTISGVTAYDISQVTNVTASNGFSCSVTSGSYGNENASLFVETTAAIKTLKDGGTSIMDNDFTVIQNTGANTVNLNSANGYYDKAVLNDGVEITKTLKYAYMTITQGAGGNYGWNAEDREVSLYYPDVHRVYAVNQAGAFQRLNITTAGVLPQGATITGNTSGSKAVVALSNTSNTNSTALAAGFHTTVGGTGSADLVEVVFTRGSSFTAGETFRVEVPSTESAYSYTVTYNSLTAAVGTDATNLFMVDDGQRREYYDIARLVRKENASAPTATITVFFSYFDADPTTNHYYSADSYAAESFYGVNPRWTDSTREISSLLGYEGTSLRNGIDFRLRVKPVTSSANSPFNFASRDFYEQDRIMPDTVFTTDFEEFLGRIDLVSLQKDGNFAIASGVASKDPKKPDVNPNAMGLFYLHVDPVVYYPEVHVQFEKIDNRRYTMRDIGELDKRIDNLEETLSLTMLELQALNDDVDLRTKSGFVVDAFNKEATDTSAGDYYHPEYRASIDVLNKQLTTAQTSGVPIEMNVSAQVGTSSFFPGFLMKSFTEEAFSTQLRATTSQLINPFATWVYTGDVTLSPAEDHWHTRTDNYFTKLYGNLKPFSGTSADWQNFNKITVASPGGKSVVEKEWVGQPKTTSKRSGNKITKTTKRAQKTTTIAKFDTPRSTGEVTSTLTDSYVIQNPQSYWMRSMTVSYSAENLRANTEHNLVFGGIPVGTVTSDASGNVSGTFNIPDTTYRPGTELFQLVDTSTGFLSTGSAPFTSIGHMDVYKNVANAVTEMIRSTSTSDVVTGTSTSYVPSYSSKSSSSSNSSSSGAAPTGRQYQASYGGGWASPSVVNYPSFSPSSFTSCYGDPVAQMFTLPMSTTTDRQTSVITSIDLWFSKVDLRPNMNRVMVEIRESVNGYPAGQDKVVGQSGFKYLSSSNETTVITDASATNFTFREPVVLKGNTEYSIVLLSPSDVMSVYVAEIGENLIDGSGVHDSQPNVGGYYGSFFTSQNSTTWNADQNKDLTYRLKRAKFADSAATVTLTNTNSDSGYYKGDIGAYNQGLTVETFANSNYVKVYHPNHGMHYNGAEVAISGIANACNGIPASELNATHTVWYATLDSYFVKTTTQATSSGKVNTGVWTTFASQDIMYDSMISNLMPHVTDGDSVKVNVTSTITSSANLNVGTNNMIENLSIITPYADTTVSVENGNAFEFDEPRIVRSKTNTSGVDLTMTVELDATNLYSSPIIKTGSNLNPIVFRNLTGYMLDDSEIEGLTTRSLAGGETDVQLREFASYQAGVQSELEHSAYVTKQVDLEIPADGFTVKFNADMAPESSIELAYKARAIGDNTPFEDLEWIDAPTSQQITEENYGAFSSSEDEKSYTVRITTPYEFSAFKVRARLRTRNEAQVPVMSDLRIIADI